MADLTFTHESAAAGALRHWDLRGPNGLVRFEIADALGFKTASVYLHELVAPAGADLEDCDLCGKCWRNVLLGVGARSLRAEWEAAGDDEIIREALERWYNEELSTPVPVSEGLQVSGEVGPGGNGPNLAATGTGEVEASGEPVPVAAHHQTAGWGGGPGECGVECACGWTLDGFDTIAEPKALLDDHIAAANRPTPVPVAAQPLKISDEFIETVAKAEYAYDCSGDPADFAYPWDETLASVRNEYVRRAWAGLQAAIPLLRKQWENEREPAWGSGPLVEHNPETPDRRLICVGCVEEHVDPETPGTADPDGGQ